MAGFFQDNTQWSSNKALPKNTIFLDEAKSVFLTGATGLLGIYILHSLLQNKTSPHIYCLVRAKNAEVGLKRLQDTLMQYGLPSHNLSNRITVVTGNLEQDQFGLETSLYHDLAQKIDIVFHSGATINWIGTLKSLEKVNVGGTKRIIEFSKTSKVKTLHYISTTAVYYSLDIVKHGYLNKSIEIKKYSRHIIGYFKSKWLAEQLVQDAFQNGMAGTIIRPSFISGTQRSGYLPEHDLTRLFIMACIDCGAIPDSKLFIDILPTNVLAEAIVNIADVKNEGTRIYNMSNPAGISLKQVGVFANAMGFPFEVVSHDEWQLRLSQGEMTAAKHILRKLTRKMPGAEKGFMDFLSSAKIHDDDIDTIAALKGTGITCPTIDEAYLLPFLSNVIANVKIAAE